MKIYGGKHTSINYLKRLSPGQEQLKELEIFFQRLLSIVYTNALIQSQFDYCNIVWGNSGKTLFDRLQKLPNRAARVLTFQI